MSSDDATGLTIEQELRRARDRAQRYLDIAETILIGLDLDGRVRMVNRMGNAVLGYQDGELTGELFFDRCIPERFRSEVKTGFRALLDGALDEFGIGLLQLVTKSGEERLVSWRHSLLRDENGEVQGTLSSGDDVTEKKRMEKDLRLWATVLDKCQEGVMITDATGAIIAANKAVSQIVGYRPDELLGNTPALLQSGRHKPDFYRRMWQQLAEQGHWQGEIWNRRKNGEVYPEWLSISAVQDDRGQLANYVGIFSDLTRIKRSEEQLTHLTHHDLLTDLPNRWLFQDRLAQALRRSETRGDQNAVLVLDLDRFKTINDSLGHTAGDRLLTEVARRMRSVVRTEDTVARLDGDAFAVLVETLPRPQQAATLAGNLHDVLGMPYFVQQRELSLTTSLGIALSPDHGTEAGALVKNAESAMYRAKSQGGNSVQFYTTGLTAAARERFNLENRLRKAQALQQFTLHFQPIVSMDLQRIVACEALIRWERDDGTISPGRFIPVAEETGMIVDIGYWVLEAAGAQLAHWRKMGLPPLQVAINISGAQIHRGLELAEKLARMLERHHLDPQQIKLEITESTLLQETRTVEETLQALKRIGVSLAIDDFGTGFSSMLALKRYPIDTLKIDRSFVADAPRDPNDQAICCAIIAMGHSLQLSIVAEGVETEAQRAFLERQGCDHLQGFLFSKALPAPAFERLLQTSKF